MGVSTTACDNLAPLEDNHHQVGKLSTSLRKPLIFYRFFFSNMGSSDGISTMAGENLAPVEENRCHVGKSSQTFVSGLGSF
jgi:hypothetical protein